MIIKIAKNFGFCSGVRYAVDAALSAQKNTYVLGELIHNEWVVNSLKENGLVVVDSLDEVPSGATVIFRSHGVPENYIELCNQRDIKVVDCTCKFVHHTQEIVKQKSFEGKEIVIIGEPNHPEVMGLIGWSNTQAYVISGLEQDLSFLEDKNIAVVCQTTFSEEKFTKIIENIEKVCKKIVEVFKTICYTTKGRQREAYELSKNCDAMLVIGGLNSSNTNKLYDICRANCKNVFRMADADDLDYKKIKNFKIVGIVSGASTPNSQTREVLLKMEEVSTEVKVADSMEEVVARIDSESKFKRGQIVTATISEAKESGLLILLRNTKKEIELSKDELDCEVYSVEEYAAKVGESIDLMVVALNPLRLSQKLIRVLAEEESFIAELEAGKEFTMVCTDTNKGGLVGTVGTYSVFVPAKEIRPGFVKDLTKYKGKTLRLRALTIKKDKKKEIIASQRVILQEEKAARDAAKAAKEEAFFDSIAVDMVVEGKVERITSFGAFVSVNGFDCLAHISDLSWTGVDKVEDILTIGQTYSFKVLKVDKETKKVSIGYKQLQPQPWELVAEKYAVGDAVCGRVVRIAPFGAFVEVEKGIDGLVHVSQISYERIETPAAVLNVGDEVEAKIISLDVDAKKMNLSIKALLTPPERKPRNEEETAEEKPTRKPRAPRRENDDEPTGWSDNSVSVGTSIGELIEANKKNN